MTKTDSTNKYLFPLIVMASLFFLFGFITTMNNSTIDFLKNAFGLNDVQKQLPNTFFYGAYILSIPVVLILMRIGYIKGVLMGLALFATSVIGAAILTPMMGVIKSATGSIVIAISTMFIYYSYLVFFAQKGSKIR